MPDSPRQKPASNRFKATIGVAIAVIVILASAGGLYLTNRLPFHRTFTPAITGNAYTKGDAPAQTAPPSQTSPSSPSGGGEGMENKDKGTTTQTLVVPTGTFVSNHHPHLSNSPAGSGHLSSACTTTPGASCQIVFTKDSVSKSLPAQTTDAGGSAYWNDWTPQQYGITAGTWSIQAVATLGNQKQSATDALDLEVAP